VTPLLPSVLVHHIQDSEGPIVFLTGAGTSTESGIPTFRGPEGYWRVGSRNYQPTEMATARAFSSMPDEVWRWYLHRRAVCLAAAPNAAHAALSQLDARLGDRFLLVTQNVDGLHLRAGGDPDRIYEIHGNIDRCRCVRGCAPLIRPLPDATEAAALRCACGDRLRPHVAAQSAAALIVVGTSGATTLPTRMCQMVAARGAPLIVADVEETPFSELARTTPHGLFVRGTAVKTVPALVEQLSSSS
jgi:NAD-dependent deacetylase